MLLSHGWMYYQIFILDFSCFQELYHILLDSIVCHNSHFGILKMFNIIISFHFYLEEANIIAMILSLANFNYL